jgi:predicted P-loop ATPase
MAERQAAMEQIYSMAEKNARLQTQIAVNEARQHATEQLTASLIDRTEVAMKLVATRTDSNTENCEANESTVTLKAIQEDLSNIRKQIALMKRQAPVPFAPSSVGRPSVQPYVPSLQHHAPLDSADPAIACDPNGTPKY